jgi:ADP-dependent NAD(P)H-hydrate dehydratase / NAD(P)H-hydrate epimerase
MTPIAGTHLAASLCRDGGVLSIEQMSAADAGAAAAGVSGQVLMENAGRSVADAIMARFAAAPVTVLCGPGNNGGDGFVVARRLARSGWTVRVALLGERERLKGDAAGAARGWQDDVVPVSPAVLAGAGLVVDALFGAGLTRPLEGPARDTIGALRQSRLPVVAVDLPSGLHGDTGEILGDAAPAKLTVTFHRLKIGHLLLPGRMLLGEVVVGDIGIPDEVDRALDIRLWANTPRLWRAHLPRRTPSSHKYSQGHALVLGGGRSSSGAARLAARAALRAGAGAVTVLCPEEALPIYAAQLTAVMVAPFEDDAAFGEQLVDPRRTAILLGPGAGVGEPLRRRVGLALASNKVCILDADALTSFAGQPELLFGQIRGPCLFTPHEGEFARVFKLEGDKLRRARQAARQSGAIVLIKGADTVVAAPDGRAAIQPDAPSSLATAGSGDVLAGTALGLAAQGMPLFEAAAAAVWLHAAAAAACGAGLIAEDLSEALPAVLRAHQAWHQA